MQLHKTTLGATNCVASRLPCAIFGVRGYFRGATDSWLQIHDASQLPANGAVPKFTIPLASTAYYAWDWPRGLELTNGCIVVVSTTEATLTISAELADFHVDGAATRVVDNASVVGDLVTGEGSLDLFSAPAILYQLKVKFITDNGAAVWAQLFENEVSELVGDETETPLNRHKFGTSTSNNTRVFSFGTGGLRLTKACVVASAAGPTYDNSVSGDELAIEAVYKTL